MKRGEEPKTSIKWLNSHTSLRRKQMKAKGKLRTDDGARLGGVRGDKGNCTFSVNMQKK